MEVYRASAFEDGEEPLTTLTTKALADPLARGDSASVSFTWAVKDGDFIFVAVLDPEDLIKEVDENNLVELSSPTGTDSKEFGKSALKHLIGVATYNYSQKKSLTRGNNFS